MPTVGKVEQTKVYLGIDPGVSGGLALVSENGRSEAIPTPATERDIWEWFQWRGPNGQTVAGADYAVIERVHAMPGNGVSGMFRFGQSYGFLRACLIAAGIPFEEVEARTWQKALGISPRKIKAGESKTQFKNRLKNRAACLFPQITVTLATADALLIAEYCRRKRTGTL